MIAKSKNIFIYFLIIQLFFGMPSFSYAGDCVSNNSWKRLSSITMETNVVSAALTKYANKERYFSMKTKESQVDIYYLDEIFLVKGLAEAEINFHGIFLLPMVLSTPVKIASQAFPQGPCKVTKKTTFSLQNIDGEVEPATDGIINYKFIITDTKSKDVKITEFKGMMKFALPISEPDKNTDVRGYILVDGKPPYTIIGSSVLPVTTIGELRRVLKEKKKVQNHK